MYSNGVCSLKGVKKLKDIIKLKTGLAIVHLKCILDKFNFVRFALICRYILLLSSSRYKSKKCSICY